MLSQATHHARNTAPANGEVDIWLLPFEGLADKGLRRFCTALLSPDEAERAGRFALPRPQDQYIAARALVRLILARRCTVAPEALVFAANEFGRPHISAPAQARGIHFSLSHTDGLLALAVSTSYAVGLDVEDTQRLSDFTGIARNYFSPTEWQAIEPLQGEAQRERFFLIWTLKEAYMKALGQGLSAGLEAFSISVTPESASLLGGPAGAPAAHTWQFFRMQPTARHQLAVAASFTPYAPLVCRVHTLEDLRTLAVPGNAALAQDPISS
jgi:4'-phosphopantetheinyl transferase